MVVLRSPHHAVAGTVQTRIILQTGFSNEPNTKSPLFLSTGESDPKDSHRAFEKVSTSLVL